MKGDSDITFREVFREVQLAIHIDWQQEIKEDFRIRFRINLLNVYEPLPATYILPSHTVMPAPARFWCMLGTKHHVSDFGLYRSTMLKLVDRSSPPVRYKPHLNVKITLNESESDVAS